MNKREFTVKINDVDVKCFANEPDGKTKRKAAEYKAEVFKREAFKKDENGKLTAIFADQVYNLMREKGIWTDADDEELANVNKELDAKLALLAKGKSEQVDSKNKLREIVFKEVKVLRGKQFALLSKSTQFNQMTVESAAEEAELDYLAVHCVFNEDYIPLFSSIDDLYNFDSEVRNVAKYELAVLMGNRDPDWTLKLPENKLLQKHNLMDAKGNYLLDGKLVNFDGKRINEKGFLLNENDELVDEEGNRIDEEGNLLEYKPFD